MVLCMFIIQQEKFFWKLNKNGKIDGISRGYRPDGTLYQEIIYKNSKEIKRNIYPLDKPVIA